MAEEGKTREALFTYAYDPERRTVKVGTTFTSNPEFVLKDGDTWAQVERFWVYVDFSTGVLTINNTPITMESGGQKNVQVEVPSN